MHSHAAEIETNVDDNCVENLLEKGCDQEVV